MTSRKHPSAAFWATVVMVAGLVAGCLAAMLFNEAVMKLLRL